MTKIHCDACDRVFGEGDCLPPTGSIVTIQRGYNIMVQITPSKPNASVDLCRSCEVEAAQQWLLAVEKTFLLPETT